jgi:prepilin signal peptidase PulO-like enzyme (type II secretory pathway)
MLVTIVVVTLIGLIAGGLVNVLADDLPHYRWPRLPRYPDGMPRPVIAWLGLSAFASGQRSSPSGAKLSWRYPLAEAATIIMMLTALAVKNNNPNVSDLQFVFWLFYMAVFVLITVIDLEHKLILFAVIIPSSLIAVLDAIVTPTRREPDLRDALIGGLAGFGVFFLLYIGGYVYVYISNQLQRGIDEIAFGYGDVMMALFSGLVLGWQALIFAMFITVFLGAFGAVAWIVGRKVAGGDTSLFTALPYGPYIVAGTAIMLLFSGQVRLLVAGY